MGVSVATLTWLDYSRSVDALDRTIAHEMQVCSYDLSCPEYRFDFVDLNTSTLNRLARTARGDLYTDFSIPDSKRYALRIRLPKPGYEARIETIAREALGRFALALLAVALLALLFSWYALRPLRRAFSMMEEFVRDILHDFNTPLSTIRLNLAMLRRRDDAPELERIEKGVQTIVDLQQNLHDYLEQVASNARRIDLARFVKERADLIKSAYPSVRFDIDLPPVTLMADPKALARILDNLLDNAAKHTRQSRITIRYEIDADKLTIEDDGPGIRKPSRVFRRHYKEGEKGSGLGMHIVKKLCDAMGIGIGVDSRPGEGTRITLEFGALRSERSGR